MYVPCDAGPAATADAEWQLVSVTASDHASAGWASAVFATTLGQQLAWQSIRHLRWPPIQVNAVLAFQFPEWDTYTPLASLLVLHHNRRLKTADHEPQRIGPA